VAHNVSLTYLRFDHMSPAGVALATLLHASVALALWWVSPLHPLDATPDVIEVSMEQEAQPPPPPEPPPPEPPPVQAAAPPPPPPPPQQQTPTGRMGLRPPIGTTMDQRAPLSPPPPSPTAPEKPVEAPPAQETAKPEPAKEAAAPEPPKEIVKTEPPKESATPEPVQKQEEQQQAALAPQPPAPKLENALPPVEAPPPPLTSREIPALAPPSPPPKPAPQPAARPQTPPTPTPRAQTPPQQLPPSPLHPPQHAPTDPQQAARPAPAPLTNPADLYGQRKAQEDYLWQVVRKIAQHRYYPKSSRENSEEGLVVTLVTIARDGRLLDATISRSSGFRTLDNAVLEVIRQSAPYAPLPNDVLGDRHTFVLPLNYRRTDPQ
jgi:TonB family protein